MEHNLKISVSKEPQTSGIVSCKSITFREKFVRDLFGEKKKVTDDWNALNKSVTALTQAFADGDEQKLEPEAKPQKQQITLGQVRGMLADRSCSGFTAEVRSLITGYGVNRLSDIVPEHYEASLKVAEGIGK